MLRSHVRTLQTDACCPRLKNISRFSRNSEAFASDLLENLNDMFLRYYMDSTVISRHKSLTTHESVLPVLKGLKLHKYFSVHQYLENVFEIMEAIASVK